MDIKCQLPDGQIKSTYKLAEDATLEDLTALFYADFKYYPERQRWKTADGRVIVSGSLQAQGLKSKDSVYFKDLGIQISWRLVYVIEYLGPLLIFPLMRCIYGAYELDLARRLAFWLFMGHFVKREIETLFVHRFSKATMPLHRLPINCLHYWILAGVLIGRYMFDPNYSVQWSNHPLVAWILALSMVTCEVMNWKTHIILRSLRERGSTERGIPHGSGFDLVSCANYMWETLAWIAFAALINVATAWLFVAVAFVQMSSWAQKKHRNYLTEFDKYPKNRKAIIPYVH